MNAVGLKALFEPFAAVIVKRMFGGHGVYAEASASRSSPGERCSSKSTPDLNQTSKPLDRRHSSTTRRAGRCRVLSGGFRPLHMRMPMSCAAGPRSGSRGRAAPRRPKARRNAGRGWRRRSLRLSRRRRRHHSSASAGSRAWRTRVFTGRKRKLGTWSPRPITRPSLCCAGRTDSRRGEGWSEGATREAEARS